MRLEALEALRHYNGRAKMHFASSCVTPTESFTKGHVLPYQDFKVVILADQRFIQDSDKMTHEN